MDTEALQVTLRLALTTTAILLTIGIPLAAWIALSKSPIRHIAEAAVALPLVLPPTVLGFYLLVGLGPTTAIGQTITKILGHTLAFSFTGLIAGSVIYSLPFAVQPILVGLRAVSPAYLETAGLLGAGPARAFREVALPLAKGSILTAALLTFLHTVGEFGVVLMLGGNIPGTTRTLSISLYDMVENGHFDQANTVALALLVASSATLIAIYGRAIFSRKPDHV